MSKSANNYVGITEPPFDMLQKLMLVDDAVIWRYYELLSSLDNASIADLRADVAANRATIAAPVTTTSNSPRPKPSATPIATKSTCSRNSRSTACQRTFGPNGHADSPGDWECCRNPELRLVAPATKRREVVRAGIEPATHGFSVHCSTN